MPSSNVGDVILSILPDLEMGGLAIVLDAAEVAMPGNEMLHHHLLRHWPCPALPGSTFAEDSILNARFGEIHEDGCLPTNALIEQRRVTEPFFVAPAIFPPDPYDLKASVVYECGSSRTVPVGELYFELLRLNWDPQIEWTTRHHDGYELESGATLPAETTIGGTTVCAHGAETLEMHVTYLRDEIRADDELVHLRQMAVEAVRRGIMLAVCSCVPPDVSARAFAEHIADRLIDHGELHAAVVSYRPAGFGDGEPHSGEWVDRPEILDGPLNLDVSSGYTSTPEETIGYDETKGATLADLGIHLEGRIDRALEIIDRTLEEVHDADDQAG